MYKITYVPTGHIFELPDDAANELKEKFLMITKLSRKTVKKVRESRTKKTKKVNSKSIYSKVVEE